jgi:hypothetical protein
MPTAARGGANGPVFDAVNALADREGELEIRLEGTRRIRLRMRDPSEQEKPAHSDRSNRRPKALAPAGSPEPTPARSVRIGDPYAMPGAKMFRK